MPRKTAARPAPGSGNRLFGVAIFSAPRRAAVSLATIAAQAVAERRLFVLLPFALILGIIAYRVTGYEPDAEILVGGMLLAMCMAAFLRRSYGGVRAVALLIAAWAGYCALPVQGALFGTSMLTTPKYGHYTMRLDQVIYDDGDQQRWIVSEIVPENARDAPGVRRARLSAPGGVAVRPGDTIEARVRFYGVPPPVLPGGYDAQFAGYYAGIGAYGAVLGDPVIVPAEQGGFYGLVEDVRRTIASRILAVLDPQIGGIAIALITGDRSRIPEDDWQAMALVGLAHVLSISGMHMTLVAGTMYASLRIGISLSYGFSQKVSSKKIAAAGGIVIAIAYMLVSGMGIPAIRAAIMLVLVFGAVIAGRQALTMRNVALAGLLLAAFDPATVFRASYQLSFAAVVALIAAFELARQRREERWKPANRGLAILIDVAMTSLVAGAATLMFSAYHFQQTAPFGVISNVLAMPIVSFVMMPAAVFAILLLPLGLEAPLLHVMGWSIEAVLWIAHTIRVLSGGFDPSPLLAPSALVVCLIALAWLAFFQSRIRLVGPIIAVPIIFLFCVERSPDVLIADSTQALAVRHEGRLTLMAGRLNTFATTVWSERYMETIDPRSAATSCDTLGCILHSSHGFTLALVLDRAAFQEDCAIADVVVARVPAPQWCGQITEQIDPKNLSERGAHMLYWREDLLAFEARYAISDGNRPWRPQVKN